MKFAGICLVTNNVDRLGDFYSELLNIEKCGDSNHTYFEFDNFHISICPKSLEESIAPGSTLGRDKSNNILEFSTETIDAKYQFVIEKGYKIIKPIKTEVWGIRSFWIEDPDGNIINFCCNMNN